MIDSLLKGWCMWLGDTAVSMNIRESVWLYPMLHWVHILANTFMLGSIVFVDLRLLGAGFARRRVTDMTQQLLPWTWTGWILMFLSGAAIFTSDPVRYYGSNLMRAKFSLMLFAGINALIFHFTVYRGVASWDEGRTPPRARLAGVLSILSWLGVMFTARAVGYFS